jgi:hypothetical protein
MRHGAPATRRSGRVEPFARDAAPKDGETTGAERAEPAIAPCADRPITTTPASRDSILNVPYRAQQFLQAPVAVLARCRRPRSRRSVRSRHTSQTGARIDPSADVAPSTSVDPGQERRSGQ